MTSMVGHQGSDGGGLDVLAINRDADLLDQLARRGPVPAGDPVLALLAALAADVDEGLDELLVAGEDDPLARAASVATVVPGPPAPRRGRGLRVTTVAIVVGATLSIGGVAAAVTGDPLAPVKGVATAVGIGADTHDGTSTAKDAARQTRSSLAHGDVAGAQVSLATMKAELLRDDLSKGDRRSLEARVAALQKQVDHAIATAADPPGGAEADGNRDGDGTVDDGTVDDGTDNGNGNGNGKVDDGTGNGKVDDGAGNGNGKVDDGAGNGNGNGKVDDGTGNGNGKVDDGTGAKGRATGHDVDTANAGKPKAEPHATRTTEPGAGRQGGATSHDKKSDGTAEPSSDPTSDSASDRVKPSHAAGSGSRPRQSSPSSADDQEDAPAAPTATADPSTPPSGSGASGSHEATGEGGAGDSGAGSSKAHTKGASTAR